MGLRNPTANENGHETYYNIACYVLRVTYCVGGARHQWLKAYSQSVFSVLSMAKTPRPGTKLQRRILFSRESP